jgi:diguanylate cyclase
MQPFVPNVSPFADLAEAAHAAMLYLRDELKLGHWMFTRVQNDDWVILDTVGKEYPIEAGAVLAWSDSFCSRMVAGAGPMIAPRAADVPAYAAAPVARVHQIESYVGMPILRSDGSLFGTMCAIDKAPAGDIERYQPLVELFARTLGFAVDRQHQADEAGRRADQARSEALTDGLTGIFNRKGWDTLVDREEDRCRRYGYPACAFVVDLDGFKEINDTLGHSAGDVVLQNAAACLKGAFRASDIVARTGGDEFSVLAIECDDRQAQELLKRTQATLAQHSIAASVGFAYVPAARLLDVWKVADRAMYDAKRGRKRTHARGLLAATG